jgi:ParB/RepB/Spo0J family partition protein
MLADRIRQQTWSVDRLRENEANPRGKVGEADVVDLLPSIREQGVIEPLVVVDNWDGSATVVCGHRRLAAARLAGLGEVPVVLRELTPTQQLELMLTENIQRQDLTLLQEARAFKQLRDAGHGNSDIARRLGLQPNYVWQRLAILKCDPLVQDLFGRRELPVTLAQHLSRIGDAQMQRRLAARAANRQMTIAQLEETIKRGLGEGVLPAADKASLEPPKVTAPPRRWPTRLEAIALLRGNPERQVSHGDLERLFDATCGICHDCGMSELEVACRECPLPQFVRRLVS